MCDATVAADIDEKARETLNSHKPCVVWFTGLPGSGKSAIANELERGLQCTWLPYLSSRRRQRSPRTQP
ncbi:adenylyl-sulfate kinase [Rhodococcus sp. IEGM 1379]|nr:adenylyl-sulfate kinase [Rhodococcus sp. IEGM 1379]MDI9917499.1 adenylyl-sulfate kinase [Rhodococcus sp. IEGM 1379]